MKQILAELVCWWRGHDPAAWVPLGPTRPSYLAFEVCRRCGGTLRQWVETTIVPPLGREDFEPEAADHCEKGRLLDFGAHVCRGSVVHVLTSPDDLATVQICRATVEHLQEKARKTIDETIAPAEGREG